MPAAKLVVFETLDQHLAGHIVVLSLEEGRSPCAVSGSETSSSHAGYCTWRLDMCLSRREIRESMMIGKVFRVRLCREMERL